jgi:hypothetical protein
MSGAPHVPHFESRGRSAAPQRPQLAIGSAAVVVISSTRLVVPLPRRITLSPILGAGRDLANRAATLCGGMLIEFPDKRWRGGVTVV